MRPFFTVLLSLFLSSGAMGEDRPLKAAMFDLAPWATADGKNSKGIIPLLIDELGKEIGQPIDRVTVPYPRMFKLVETGAADFAIFFQSAKSREIAEPLHVFYLMRTSIIAAQNLPQGKLRIATGRGILFDNQFDRGERYTRILSNDHAHSVQLLLSGRVDGVAGPEKQIISLINTTNPDYAYQVLEILNTNKVTLQFSKRSDNQHKREALKQAAKAIHARGIVDRLLESFPYTAIEFDQSSP